jgi:hypothetical protein
LPPRQRANARRLRMASHLGIACKDLPRDALKFIEMNPDKLFDYLEGRLPAAERAALELQLISDNQLQRELAVARRIHAGMRGESREVLLPSTPDVTEQGRKMALRVGAAFIVLMAVNVGIGLWLIARHETKNPNRAMLETQMRRQIANSLGHAAATFTPAPLGVSEIMVPAASGKLETVADEVVTIATRFGGSAIKGLPDKGRLNVLVDLPSNREPEFRAGISSISGATETAGSPATAGATTDKKSFVVQIVEAGAKHD